MTHIEMSKFLSYILRHQPESIGLTLDKQGWANIASLIEKAKQHGVELDNYLIKSVVTESNKKRFTFSDDGLFIRAAQGHSAVMVALEREEKEPPNILYHGTASRFVESILRQGLLPGARHDVHLSENAETAQAVGQRHGKAVVLEIQAKKMYQDGFKFCLSENGVWLCEHVPIAYLIVESG